MLLPNEQDKLLRLVDENCLAIIWLHEGSLTDQIPYFSEINYLSNGLILQSLENDQIDVHLFHSNNFSKPLYIYFLNSNIPDLIKKVDSITSIIKKEKEENSHLIILEPKSSHHGKQIKSQYSKYHFQIIHY
ncbi:MAG: hypothetical protein COW00_09180 [Bdellovibrio sp. CG12_big_fil_rev_8_21_14_0_65_39_13]|nr:MAG: hypothetical protein COW78_09250 [Bdellovibrio sp. CG22_combo_CG10-13_8_21_14_all_39_27]PIQ59794.1 MAG: hypothetical protein COW00_09180 [Bdellovibrio sp. CG12_big_fil_rev_8_21_14_0_65_39_13]PIR36178.1 MAG: hypothetical protein COV37_04210 [Bdellovibrio sp. CG11_big_fil_rev_8_21_14_0_20_39_38]